MHVRYNDLFARWSDRSFAQRGKSGRTFMIPWSSNEWRELLCGECQQFETNSSQLILEKLNIFILFLKVIWPILGSRLKPRISISTQRSILKFIRLAATTNNKTKSTRFWDSPPPPCDVWYQNNNITDPIGNVSFPPFWTSRKSAVHSDLAPIRNSLALALVRL